MKITKILCIFLTLVFVICAIPMALAAKTSTEAAGIPQASNVKFVADKGSNDNNGDTAATPYATFQYAVSKLASTGGVIVIVGVTTITVDNLVMDPNEKLITVTSFYNGTDYRNVKFAGDIINPCISLSNGATASWDFYGEYFFDYITFNPEKSSCILAFNYNNFSFGENIETTFYSPDGSTWFDGMFDGVNDARTYPPIVLIGNNRKDGGETISKDINVSVASGTWQSIRLGDRDNMLRNTFTGKANIVISGGLYPPYTGTISTYNCSVMGAYQVCTTPEAVVTVTITGGTFNGQISAIGPTGTISAGDFLQQGTFYLNIFGGKWNKVYQADGNFIYTIQNDLQAGVTEAKVIVSVDVDKLTYGDYNTMTFVSSVMIHSALFLTKTADNVTSVDFEDDYTGFATIALPSGVTAAAITSVKVGDYELLPAARIDGTNIIVPSDGKSAVVLTAGDKAYSAAHGATSFGAPTAATTAPETTKAPVTTAATAETSTSTGDFALVFTAAALIAVAAVIVIRKKETAR